MLRNILILSFFSLNVIAQWSIPDEIKKVYFNNDAIVLDPDFVIQSSIAREQFSIQANELGLHMIRIEPFIGVDENYHTVSVYDLIENRRAKTVNGGGLLNDTEYTAYMQFAAVDQKLYIFGIEYSSKDLIVKEMDLDILPLQDPPVQHDFNWTQINSRDLTGISNVLTRVTDIALDEDNFLIHLVLEDGLEVNEHPNTQTKVIYIGYDYATNKWVNEKIITEGGGTLSKGYNPSVAFDGNQVFVAYLTNQGVTNSISYLRFREYNSTWQAIQTIDNRTELKDSKAGFASADIAVSNNKIHVVSSYYTQNAGNILEHTYRNISSGTFSSFAPVETDAGTNLHKNDRGLDLLSDDDGLHLVYADRESNNPSTNPLYSIKYRKLNPDNTWGNSTTLSSSNGHYYTPLLASNRGGLHCVYERRDADSDNTDYFRENDGFIMYAGIRKTYPKDNSPTEPTFSENTFLNGSIVNFGENVNGSDDFTIAPGVSVVTYKDTNIKLNGNNVIVKGTFAFHSDNIDWDDSWGNVGQIINSGGTIINLDAPAAPQNLAASSVCN